MPSIKQRNKMDIRELHALVHQGQDKGVPVKVTLAKYKVTDRSYYTRCKQNNLPSWRMRNKSTIMTGKRGRQPKGNLTGGSLQGGDLSKPKKSLEAIKEEIAVHKSNIKARQKKNKELDIKLQI